MRHVVETKEVIEIASQLLFVAAFSNSDGIQVVVLGALRGLQDENTDVYYICGLLGSWFSNFNLFGVVY
jgi:MATE family multidrug resistance protein